MGTVESSWSQSWRRKRSMWWTVSVTGTANKCLLTRCGPAFCTTSYYATILGSYITWLLFFISGTSGLTVCKKILIIAGLLKMIIFIVITVRKLLISWYWSPCDIRICSHNLLQDVVVIIVKVKLWITFNEPLVFTCFGYGYGFFAPGVQGLLSTMFTVAHTVIRAHACAWHTYDHDFRPSQSGLPFSLLLYSEAL